MEGLQAGPVGRDNKYRLPNRPQPRLSDAPLNLNLDTFSRKSQTKLLPDGTFTYKVSTRQAVWQNTTFCRLQIGNESGKKCPIYVALVTRYRIHFTEWLDGR